MAVSRRPGDKLPTYSLPVASKTGTSASLDDKGPRIAVTPLKVCGNDPDLRDLAEDLSEASTELRRSPRLS